MRVSQQYRRLLVSVIQMIIFVGSFALWVKFFVDDPSVNLNTGLLFIILWVILPAK